MRANDYYAKHKVENPSLTSSTAIGLALSQREINVLEPFIEPLIRNRTKRALANLPEQKENDYWKAVNQADGVTAEPITLPGRRRKWRALGTIALSAAVGLNTAKKFANHLIDHDLPAQTMDNVRPYLVQKANFIKDTGATQPSNLNENKSYPSLEEHISKIEKLINRKVEGQSLVNPEVKEQIGSYLKECREYQTAQQEWRTEQNHDVVFGGGGVLATIFLALGGIITYPKGRKSMAEAEILRQDALQEFFELARDVTSAENVARVAAGAART